MTKNHPSPKGWEAKKKTGVKRFSGLQKDSKFLLFPEGIYSFVFSPLGGELERGGYKRTLSFGHPLPRRGKLYYLPDRTWLATSVDGSIVWSKMTTGKISALRVPLLLL